MFMENSDVFDGISSARVASHHPGTNMTTAWKSLQTAMAPAAKRMEPRPAEMATQRNKCLLAPSALLESQGNFLG